MAPSIWKRKICTEQLIFSESERWSYRSHTGLKTLENETLNDQVLCHHYSWVRTKDEMLQKVKSWGHSADKNWTQLVEEEFSRDFNGTDFVHGYTYDIVPNTLN
jgi:hypothetical protein